MRINSLFTSFLLAILLWVAIFYMCWNIFLSGIILCLCMLILILILFFNRQLWTIFLSLSIGIIVWIFIAYFDNVNKESKTTIIDRYNGLYVKQEWTVKEVYKRSQFSDQYIILKTRIWEETLAEGIFSLVSVPKNFSLHPGQKIQYMSKIYKIQDFDFVRYRNYMLSKNIYFSSKTNSIDTVENHMFWFRYFLFHSRQSMLHKIHELYPQREAIFLAGILLWAREDIPQDLKDNFNNSWLTHFIAVSGFNITLCIIFFGFLFQFFPPKIRIIWVTAWIILFALFVWLWAPVIRASIMWIIAYLFLQSWTTSRNISLLAFTAVVMILVSPLTLLYDLSFHLSFLAVIWIIYTQDFFKKVFYWAPSVFAIKEALILTLSAMVFSIPVMLFQFWQIPLLSPIANIAVTWTIPIAMLLWTISLILELIYIPLWEAWAYITWIFLRYDMLIVESFWGLDQFILKMNVWYYKNYLQALYFILLSYIVIMYHMRKIKQS